MNPNDVMDSSRSSEDPAAMLLRSARSDAAPSGAKDRVRAMLGIDAVMEESDALPLPAKPQRTRIAPKKGTSAIARIVPFQHMLAVPKPMPIRKFGAIATAAVQVAAVVAAIFVRPFPRFEPAPEKPVARHDEPEVAFFVPKAKKPETPVVTSKVQEINAKPLPARKEGFGKVASLRSAPVLAPAPMNEAIVGDEHAGVLLESVAKTDSVIVDAPPVMAPAPAIPMAFQSGMAQPERIFGIDPSYPKIARMRGVSGTVIMRCVINENGLPQNCTILKSPAYLDEAVLSAARSWRFAPMKWQGRTVSVNYVFKYQFKLG